MRTIHIFILMTAAALLSLPASAATVLHYDMNTTIDGETPTPGALINPQGATAPAAGIPDLSGNGNDMYGWANATQNNSPAFSEEGDTPTGEGFSIYCDGGDDGYTMGSINTWAPETWTVEAAVKLDVVDQDDALIGRDDITDGDSDFYLQNSADGSFLVSFVTVGGGRATLNSTGFTAVADTWYRVAVTSDGATLKMFVNEDGVYQPVGSTSLPHGTAAQNTPLVNGGVWTFGRAQANSNQAKFLAGNLDDIRFSDRVLGIPELLGNTLAAYDPSPADKSIDAGTLVGTQADVTLSFKAGRDPNELVTGNAFNPKILEHHIYLGTGPNPDYLTTIAQTSPTDPVITYELPDLLDGGTVYYWKVEEGLNDGSGNAYAPGDPNNIAGPIWSFTTIAPVPSILTDPQNTVADTSGNAAFSVTASASTTSYQWYKVVGEQDAGGPGSGDDVMLSDGGIFSGATTSTLTLTGAALADEGQYYAYAYNGATVSDEPSAPAALWMRRLAGYWKLDGNMNDSVTDEVPGAPTHDGIIQVATQWINPDPEGNDGPAVNPGPGDPNYVGDGNGIDGNAMAFYNDGDYMAIPDSDFFNFYPQGMTVSYWVKYDAQPGWRIALSKLDANARTDVGAGWLFGKQTADPYVFIIENPNTTLDQSSETNVADGQWHMVTATYDPASTTLRLFIDGQQEDTATIDLSTAPLPVLPLSIGGLAYENAIDGAIDEVMVYTYAKTPKEVAAMYLPYSTVDYLCVIPDEADGFAALDLNNDCRINLDDFAMVASQWLECQRVPDTLCYQ